MTERKPGGTSAALEIRAGPAALAHIQESGLAPGHVQLIPGAAGGAKWLVLRALDNYLFRHWLAGRETPVDTVGSSIGSWRFAAAATDRTDQLLDLYLHQEYSASPDAVEITGVARRILAELLPRPRAVLDSPRLRLHILTARCTGPLASEHRGVLGAGLLLTALANAIHPTLQQWAMRRHLFGPDGAAPGWARRPGWSTEHSRLSVENLVPALQASGSIPLVLEGVRDIAGAGNGVYRDGGVTDYHMPLSYAEAGGIVLFPHFSGTFKAGWFDKHLGWRRMAASGFDNVVLLFPSADFIDGLPHGRIPDRHDFTRYEPSERLRIWNQVVSECDRLAEELDQWFNQGCPADRVSPL
ncbi:MAG: hypothetical protein QNJ40_08410 [Xanthomonadales bacterium]|nr:hypothetical protein [Xanthomonadales bacterium]